jgi:uncharacterized sodium:solute symporter family permease YidK
MSAPVVIVTNLVIRNEGYWYTEFYVVVITLQSLTLAEGAPEIGHPFLKYT